MTSSGRQVWLDQLRDPLVQRHLAEGVALQAAGVKGYLLRYAWQAVAEHRMYTALFGLNAIPLTVPGSSHADPRSHLDLARRMQQARTYLWRNDDVALAKSAPLPEHVFGSYEQFTPSFWALESDLTVLDRSTGSELLDIDDEGVAALFVFEANGGVIFIDIRVDAGHQKMEAKVARVPHGMRWPNDFTEEQRAFLNMYVRMYWYACSPKSTDLQLIDPRPERRRLLRNGIDPDGLMVHLVSRPAAHSYAESGRRMETRHWVSGHYKAQWLPSARTHRVMWIDPYLRGPTDTPIIATKSHGVVRAIGGPR